MHFSDFKETEQLDEARNVAAETLIATFDANEKGARGAFIKAAVEQLGMKKVSAGAFWQRRKSLAVGNTEVGGGKSKPEKPSKSRFRGLLVHDDSTTELTQYMISGDLKMTLARYAKDILPVRFERVLKNSKSIGPVVTDTGIGIRLQDHKSGWIRDIVIDPKRPNLVFDIARDQYFGEEVEQRSTTSAKLEAGDLADILRKYATARVGSKPRKLALRMVPLLLGNQDTMDDPDDEVVDPVIADPVIADPVIADPVIEDPAIDEPDASGDVEPEVVDPIAVADPVDIVPGVKPDQVKFSDLTADGDSLTERTKALTREMFGNPSKIFSIKKSGKEATRISDATLPKHQRVEYRITELVMGDTASYQVVERARKVGNGRNDILSRNPLNREFDSLSDVVSYMAGLFGNDGEIEYGKLLEGKLIKKYFGESAAQPDELMVQAIMDEIRNLVIYDRNIEKWIEDMVGDVVNSEYGGIFADYGRLSARIKDNIFTQLQNMSNPRNRSDLEKVISILSVGSPDANPDMHFRVDKLLDTPSEDPLARYEKGLKALIDGSPMSDTRAEVDARYFVDENVEGDAKDRMQRTYPGGVARFEQDVATFRKLTNGTDRVVRVLYDDPRAYHQAARAVGTSQVNVGDSDTGITYHEFGHSIEAHTPWVLSKTKKFLKSLAGDPQWNPFDQQFKPIRQMGSRYSHYDVSEVSVDANRRLTTPYIAKYYGPMVHDELFNIKSKDLKQMYAAIDDIQSSEVLSMGLQNFKTPKQLKHFRETDPILFEFTLNILEGLQK